MRVLMCLQVEGSYNANPVGNSSGGDPANEPKSFSKTIRDALGFNSSAPTQDEQNLLSIFDETPVRVDDLTAALKKVGWSQEAINTMFAQKSNGDRYYFFNRNGFRPENITLADFESFVEAQIVGYRDARPTDKTAWYQYTEFNIVQTNPQQESDIQQRVADNHQFIKDLGLGDFLGTDNSLEVSKIRFFIPDFLKAYDAKNNLTDTENSKYELFFQKEGNNPYRVFNGDWTGLLVLMPVKAETPPAPEEEVRAADDSRVQVLNREEAIDVEEIKDEEVQQNDNLLLSANENEILGRFMQTPVFAEEPTLTAEQYLKDISKLGLLKKENSQDFLMQEIGMDEEGSFTLGMAVKAIANNYRYSGNYDLELIVNIYNDLSSLGIVKLDGALVILLDNKVEIIDGKLKLIEEPAGSSQSLGGVGQSSDSNEGIGAGKEILAQREELPPAPDQPPPAPVVLPPRQEPVPAPPLTATPIEIAQTLRFPSTGKKITSSRKDGGVVPVYIRKDDDSIDAGGQIRLNNKEEISIYIEEVVPYEIGGISPWYKAKSNTGNGTTVDVWVLDGIKLTDGSIIDKGNTWRTPSNQPAPPVPTPIASATPYQGSARSELTNGKEVFLTTSRPLIDDVSGRTLVTILSGEKVKIIGSGGYTLNVGNFAGWTNSCWYKIEYDGQQGFVYDLNKNSLSIQPASVSPQTELEDDAGKIEIDLFATNDRRSRVQTEN